MFRKLFRQLCVVATLFGLGGTANAAFHLWQISEVYSNASGTIQFIEFQTTYGGQQFLGVFHSITFSNGVVTNSFTFPTDLPGDSANKKFLIGTTGFAALGIVTPDYIVPNAFLAAPGGTLNFAAGSDVFVYLSQPTDGSLSLNRNYVDPLVGGAHIITTAVNSPTNFAGQTGTIIPPSPPGAPTIGTATPGIGQAAISFTAPASNGGSPITGYTVSCAPGPVIASGAASPITVMGLANGDTYACSVAATNAIGTGPTSTTVNVTTLDVPGAPTIGNAIAGNNQASIFFTAPASNGGSPITGFAATCNPGGIAMTGAFSPITVTGLANGTAYLCSVTATNAVGTGPASTTVGVTPSAVAPLTLLTVTTRKTHGLTGTFDIPVDTTQPVGGPVTMEPRALGAGHTIAFQFNQPIATTGIATAVDGAGNPVGAPAAVPSGNEVVVTLSAVPDNSRATVHLSNVNGAGVDVFASLGFLVGDVNGSRSVTATDILQVKGRSGQVTNATNFTFDLNASGSITASDILAVKGRSGSVLPAALTLGGTITGLASTVVLQNNGGSNLTLTANGPFTFPNAVANSSPYAVTVLTQPSGQTCLLGNASGTVGGANVTNVTVSCGAAVLSNAGSDQSVNVTDSVKLDGSASSGPGGGALTYAWSFVSRPAGSAATLSGASSAKPGFDPDEPGEYVLQLVVNDGTSGSAADTVSVTASSQVVRFVVTGAQGKGNTGQTSVANAMDAKCDLSGCDYIVGVGNNIYDSGASSTSDPQFTDKFVTPYAGIDLPFWLGLGNHDYGGSGLGNEFLKALNEINYSAVNPKWRMPAAYYRRTDKHVEFFTLDTNLQMYGMDAQQEIDVEAWISSSTAYWKIALGLHGYRSNGPHGNAGSYENLPFIPIANGAGVRDFIEDHVCGKAQVYFSAHDHSLQWLQQDAINCPGTELIVSGTGASTSTLTSGPNPTHFQSATLGFAYVVIRDRQLTLEFVGTNGATLFTRTITR